MNRKLQEMEGWSVWISSPDAVKDSYFEEEYKKCEQRLFNAEDGISNIQTWLKSRHIKE